MWLVLIFKSLKQRTLLRLSQTTTSGNQKNKNKNSNRTGHLLHSTALIDGEEEEQRKSLTKSGHVRCAAVDGGFKYLITSGEDKMLKVWELDGLKLLSERYVFLIGRF